MHYRRLGRSGLKVSEISLGAWITFGDQVNQKTASQLIHAAYENGVNFFDNADVYAEGQAEIVMGRAIQDLPRSALVISSKVFWQTMPGPNGRGLSRKHLTESLHASLERLGLDYLDLYFCHRHDPDTPIEEVVYTMNRFIQQGKILYWGTSEWSGAQIAEAHGIARQYGLIPPTMEQPNYSLLHRKRFEEEIAPVAAQLGIGLTTFSPLNGGLLTGKYNEGIPEGSRAAMEENAWMKDRINEKNIARVRALAAIAKELAITPAQLAIAWILRRKEVSSVITGATRLSQLEDNLAAAEAVNQLDNEVLEAIEHALKNPT